MDNAQHQNQQWLRTCSFTLADRSGAGIEMGDLRVTFKIERGSLETPNAADIRVYNLSDQTASKVQKEFTRVILQGGYRDNTGILFAGNVIQIRRGKENGTDTWLEIFAGDGDRAYNFATVNTTLSAGTSTTDEVRVCQQAFTAKGVEGGFMPDLSGIKRRRGKVMYGMARKYLRDVAVNEGCSWSMQDDKLQIVKNDAYLPGEAVVLTAQTGLIGTPEQTNEGIKVRCLINPRLRINGRIKLDNTSIQRGKRDIYMGDLGLARINNDGFYRVLKMSVSGDTRGNDWYMDLICIGLDDTSRMPLDMTG